MCSMFRTRHSSGDFRCVRSVRISEAPIAESPAERLMEAPPATNRDDGAEQPLLREALRL